MDLKELGSRLKEERQRQGLTVEQIMEITKVSRVNINAIEDGNQKEFPHQVYAKGFIKNYAKVLGLDAEEIGEEFSKIISSNVDDEDIYQPAEPKQHDYSESAKKGSLGTIFLIIILIGVLGGLVYYLHDNSMLGFGQKDNIEITETEESVAGKTAKEEGDTVPIEEQVVEEEQTSDVEQTEVVAEKSAIQDELAEADIAHETVSENNVQEQQTAPVASVKNVVVISVKPGEACWLEAVNDGKSKEYVIQEGDDLTLAYNDSLKVKLGNAGGVNIISDGKPFEFAAPKGRVKILEFTAAQ